MAHYIDKDALVEEIERRIKSINSCPFRTAELGSEKSDEGQLNAYNVMLSFIDTLEVKEVDFEKELSLEDYNSFFEKHPNLSDDWGFNEAWIFANYFFELGLEAQKGE